MKQVPKHLIVLALSAATVLSLTLLHPWSPQHENVKMTCTFAAAGNVAPLIALHSRREISEFRFEGELSGRSLDADTATALWHADGTATLDGSSQQMSGSVFQTTVGNVTGMALYRDRYPHQADDLRISTLDENGQLNWNENKVFVYFGGASTKLDHPFDYRCEIAPR